MGCRRNPSGLNIGGLQNGLIRVQSKQSEGAAESNYCTDSKCLLH